MPGSKVAVVAFDGVVSADLTSACEVLGRVADVTGRPAYEVRVCAQPATVATRDFDLTARHDYSAVADAHTVVVPGIDDLRAPISEALVKALAAAWSRGARIASICTGAFVLAKAGLLDGRRATTHWWCAPELARRYPTIDVDPAVLYVDHGQLLTSAGAAAGLDLCLHLIRRDFGADVAAKVARMAVIPLEREGGQAQYIDHPLPDADDDLQPLLRWIEAHLDEDLRVDCLARKVAMSARTFARRFSAQTGTTPARWIQAVRLRRAQQLLEITTLSVEEIAMEVGYGSGSTLRESFRRRLGTAPQTYRRRFGRAAPCTPSS